MYKVKCIEKIRDKNNHIIEYKLIGNNNDIKTLKYNELKKHIRSGQIEVINLTLTSDNRLIDKKQDTPSKPTVTHSKQDSKAESLLNRVRTLGYNINSFNTDCRHKCYIASSPDNTKHILIIPDNVKYIYESGKSMQSREQKKLYKYMTSIKCALKVVGGKGLTSTCYLFNNCSAQYIDLSSFDTSNATDMPEMFRNCKAQSIDLRSFNTGKVTNMCSMFESCRVQSLDLSSFNTSNATDMSFMFYGCEAQFIDLRSFNTSNVKIMCKMFSNCKVHSLDLSSFNTSNVTDMHHMFNSCEAQYIDLSSFDTSNVRDMSAMFSWCEVQSLDLRSFNTSNVTDMSYMFSFCEAQYLDLTSFNTSNVTNTRWMFADCKAQINVTDPKLKAQLQHDSSYNMT